MVFGPIFLCLHIILFQEAVQLRNAVTEQWYNGNVEMIRAVQFQHRKAQIRAQLLLQEADLSLDFGFQEVQNTYGWGKRLLVSSWCSNALIATAAAYLVGRAGTVEVQKRPFLFLLSVGSISPHRKRSSHARKVGLVFSGTYNSWRGSGDSTTEVAWKNENDRE